MTSVLFTVEFDKFRHFINILWTEVGIWWMNGAFEFGKEISSKETSFHYGRMSIGKWMAMIGLLGEEIMNDRLVVEAEKGENVPHELAVTRLEVMRVTITPDFNPIEFLIKL